MALAIAACASDKKALDILLINMKKMSSVCNYFVIASGTSTTHVRAISDNIVKGLSERGQKSWHVEGEREASWILLDYGDVVAHIFLEDKREFYSLERLWAEAPQEAFAEKAPKARPKSTRPKPKRKVKPAARRNKKKAGRRKSGKRKR